jgi:hypothetical protein
MSSTPTNEGPLIVGSAWCPQCALASISIVLLARWNGLPLECDLCGKPEVVGAWHPLTWTEVEILIRFSESRRMFRLETMSPTFH